MIWLNICLVNLRIELIFCYSYIFLVENNNVNYKKKKNKLFIVFNFLIFRK